MKKLLLAVIAFGMATGTLGAQEQKNWYVTGTVTGHMNHAYKEVQDWSVGGGFGLHRMIGERFSLGVNITYLGEYSMFIDYFDYFDTIGGELSVAYFGRITDNFFYVPEIAVGLQHYLDEYFDMTAFVGGISPLGFEFRPSDSWALRANIISLAYVKHDYYKMFALSLRPTVSVCYRF